MSSSISIRIFYYFLFICALICTIKSYRLSGSYDIDQDGIQRRSVLWPRMCVTFFKEMKDPENSLDDNDRQIWFQPIRKCYPHDLQ